MLQDILDFLNIRIGIAALLQGFEVDLQHRRDAFALVEDAEGAGAHRKEGQQERQGGQGEGYYGYRFRLLYAQGGSPTTAMDACLTKQVQTSSTQAKNAAMACKAERQLGVQAFNDRYGTNANKSNAFGKCVSKARTTS